MTMTMKIMLLWLGFEDILEEIAKIYNFQGTTILPILFITCNLQPLRLILQPSYANCTPHQQRYDRRGNEETRLKFPHHVNLLSIVYRGETSPHISTKGKSTIQAGPSTRMLTNKEPLIGSATIHTTVFPMQSLHDYCRSPRLFLALSFPSGSVSIYLFHSLSAVLRFLGSLLL
jgi:hypothetical protein